MDPQKKRWLIAGGVALAVVFAAWWLFAGSEPEDDLKSLSVDKRLRAIEVLEQKDTPAAARVVASYTTDQDIQVARRSLFAIGRMRNAGQTQTLVDAMAHPKMEIREAAVAAMGTRGEKADKPALRDRLLKDPSPEVRAAAAAELGAMRDWDSMPLMMAALDDKNELVVNVVMRCILDIGGREHAGFKPGATPEQRAEAIRSLKRDWQSFKAVNDEYKRYREVMGK